MVKRVLVGIDFSPASRRALEQGSVWAKWLKVPLVVMHVIDHPEQPLFRMYAPMADPAWFQKAEPIVKESMDEWLAPYPGVAHIIRTGSPSKRLAEESNAETLLVVGNVGHGTVDSFLLGSTAERVVRHAKGDVMVIRADSP